MKLLLCEDCATLVVPANTANTPRFCDCGRHACWWQNPELGIFRVHDIGQMVSLPTPLVLQRAYIIGLTNALLRDTEPMTADRVQWLIDQHPDSYLFKTFRSLVIRIRPGHSSDTAYAPLPT